jgi:hypothetical protein
MPLTPTTNLYPEPASLSAVRYPLSAAPARSRIRAAATHLE